MSTGTQNLLGEKPIRTILLFVALALTARFIPSPWWEGQFLGVTPELPEPSGTFVSAPQANEEVKQKLAKVDLKPAETADSEKKKQTKPTEESTASSSTRRETRPTGEREDGPYWIRPHRPNRSDFSLRASIRRLDRKLDEPPTRLERPCREYYPGYLTESHRPICRERALDPFFEHLRRVALDRAERPARFTQFGDSLIAGDAFTGELRRLLQEQFGDGGYGYVHVGRASAHIGTRHLTTRTSSAWRVRDVIHDPHADVRFGLAGVAFESAGKPTLGIYPHDEGHGRKFDRVGILYYRQNRPVNLHLTVDGEGRTIDLSGPRKTNAIRWLQVEPGAQDVVVSGFSRSAYFYGVLLENSGPGVVVDNLGLSSGRAPRLGYIEPGQWRRQIELRQPDAMSFAYGVNSAGEHKASDRWLDGYADQYTELLKTARHASDETGCMVMSLLTRAGREGDDIVVYSSVEPLIRRQRDAARRSGCAFWNAYRAMGGPEGAQKWYRNRPRLLGSDLAHPTGAGYKKLANLFYASLIREFRRYLDERIRRTTIPELREDDGSTESILSLRIPRTSAQRRN